MTIKEKEDIMFAELKLKNPAIIDDGLADENSYLSAPLKIVYVLKEVNGGTDWSLREYLAAGGRAQTWNNIARWTEAIFKIDKELPWSYWEKNTGERRNEFLKKIGAVNVKKTSGGHTSDNKEVYKAAIDNGKILSQQLEWYAPDILICCGTGQAFVDACYQDSKPRWKRTSRGIPYFVDGKMTVLSFSHPEARVSPCYLLYALTDAIREIASKISPAV